jgi:hypothetical protein
LEFADELENLVLAVVAPAGQFVHALTRFEEDWVKRQLENMEVYFHATF